MGPSGSFRDTVVFCEDCATAIILAESVRVLSRPTSLLMQLASPHQTPGNVGRL
jgi:hypothetical protein